MERDLDLNRDRCSPMTPPPPPPPGAERDLLPVMPHPGLHSPPSPTRPHLPPGLFPGARGSPLPLHLAFDKTVYSSPPQASNKPENNQCRLIDYRGAKVATFNVDGRELICLPQAFDLFLKHLVGGLHTVYTKLKRLGITPVVCNVEQVRILRGLGAIQPGVNRCKLLAPKEFDVLYEDCTNSSARPGRPPKRATLGGSPDSFESMKKSRTEGDFYPPVPGRLVDPKKSPLFPNGYHFSPYHLPFMSPLAHPAMMNLAMANHLGMRPDMMHAREVLPADLSTRRHQEDKQDSHKSVDHQGIPHDSEKPLNLGMPRREEPRPDLSGLPHSGHPDLLPNGQFVHRPPISGQEESEMDDDLSDDEDMLETDEMEGSNHSADYTLKGTLEAHAKNLGMPLPPHPVPGVENPGNSAIETLLMNILGLLKVAIENARLMEEQAKQEKNQLKMEMMKERETRENMEKQLEEEQKHIAVLTKKLKRERRNARRLQEQIENVGMRQQPLPQSAQTPAQAHSQHAAMTEAVGKSGDDLCIKQAQEDLKKLNEISSRMSPAEERNAYSAEAEAKMVTSESSGTSEVHNAMESLIMSAQRLPSSCHGSANGYLHSPLIKQAEAV